MNFHEKIYIVPPLCSTNRHPKTQQHYTVDSEWTGNPVQRHENKSRWIETCGCTHLYNPLTPSTHA